MNQHTEGVAKFKSMPDESFRFRVEQQQEAQDASHWKIWLENKSSKKQWRAAYHTALSLSLCTKSG